MSEEICIRALKEVVGISEIADATILGSGEKEHLRMHVRKSVVDRVYSALLRYNRMTDYPSFMPRIICELSSLE